MASKAMGLSDFLGHKPSSGGGGNYLKNWKKREDKAFNALLHTRAGFIALWQHPVPKIQEWEDKNGVKHQDAWSGSYNCLEDEAVLKEQYKRDKETGERKRPPKVCPMCRLIERIRAMVDAGELKFTQLLFRWEGDDPKEAREIHAGGIYNGFGAKNLEKELAEEMKTAGIRANEAWAESAYAKCNYVFVVADFDNPGDGIQIATETTLLGEKVKECIFNQMVSFGEDDGNPIKNPYVLRWIHQPDEGEFSKKYKVIAMPKLKLTDEHRRLIFEEDPPNLDGYIKPGNAALLRAALQEHAVYKFPRGFWDEIFGPAEKMQGETAGSEKDEPEPESEPKPAPESKPAAVAAAAAQSSAGEDEPEAPEDDDDGFECDRCKGMMRADEYTCPHCKAEYDPKTGKLLPEKPKEEPKPKRSRSAAADEKPAKRSVAGKGYPENPKDKIPF